MMNRWHVRALAAAPALGLVILAVQASAPAANSPANSAAPTGAANIMAFGADPTGNKDSTAAIQKAIDSGAVSVYVPTGRYRFSALTMPATRYFSLFGDGASSMLVQTGAGLGWSRADQASDHQTVRDLGFDGTAGTGHTIDTTGQTGVTLENLTFNNIPAAKDAIYVDGTAGTRTHDVRIFNPAFYIVKGAPAARAMIEFGPLASDSMVQRAIGNGNWRVDYGLKVSGDRVTTLSVSASHLYNVARNALNLESCSQCQFEGNTWDYGREAIAVIKAGHSVFTNELYASTQAGKDALVLVDSISNSWINPMFGTFNVVGDRAVDETGKSDSNRFIGGNAGPMAYWSAQPFKLVSPRSKVDAVPGIKASPTP